MSSFQIAALCVGAFFLGIVVAWLIDDLEPIWTRKEGEE